MNFTHWSKFLAAIICLTAILILVVIGQTPLVNAAARNGDGSWGGPNCVELTDQSWNKTVIKGTKKMNWFVVLYSPTCGYCVKMQADFSAAATQLKKTKGIKLGALDGNNYTSIMTRYQAIGVPTILFFRQGCKGDNVRYTGKRSSTGFVNYIKQQMGTK